MVSDWKTYSPDIQNIILYMILNNIHDYELLGKYGCNTLRIDFLRKEGYNIPNYVEDIDVSLTLPLPRYFDYEVRYDQTDGRSFVRILDCSGDGEKEVQFSYGYNVSLSICEAWLSAKEKGII